MINQKNIQIINFISTFIFVMYVGVLELISTEYLMIPQNENTFLNPSILHTLHVFSLILPVVIFGLMLKKDGKKTMLISLAMYLLLIFASTIILETTFFELAIINGSILLISGAIMLVTDNYCSYHINPVMYLSDQISKLVKVDKLVIYTLIQFVVIIGIALSNIIYAPISYITSFLFILITAMLSLLINRFVMPRIN